MTLSYEHHTLVVLVLYIGPAHTHTDKLFVVPLACVLMLVRLSTVIYTGLGYAVAQEGVASVCVCHVQQVVNEFVCTRVCWACAERVIVSW